MNSIPLQIDQIGHTTEFLHPTREVEGADPIRCVRIGGVSAG
jgi:hypothetical protein